MFGIKISYQHSLKIKIYIVLSIIVLTGICQEIKSQDSKTSNTKLDSVIFLSEEIYTEYCSGCHGVVIQAFVDREWEFGNSHDDLYTSISEGRSEGEMPEFGSVFNKQQIEDLVTTINHKIENLGKYEFEEADFNSSGIFESEEFKFRLETIVQGLESPWGMVFLSNEDLLVTDKSGELWKIEKDGNKIEIKGVPEVLYEGQGGLLDIELHPDFSENGLLYFSYSIFKQGEKELLSSTAVSRYKLQGNELVDGELIFEALPYSDTRHHYGSRLEFDNEGYLYITVGDRGAREVNPQSLSLSPGKVHRIYDDGGIPDDNPFVNQPDAVRSVYSYGHRNSQGMILNPSTGKIWIHEHGPKGGDEINIITKGVNYGWPVISYGINYDGTIFTELTEKEGMEQPIHYWVPSIAPSGMDFVSGDFYPGWEGDLLVGSLRFENLNRCKIEGSKVLSEEILMKGIGRVRNVKQGPDGYIYVAAEEPGKIYKIIPVE
ncbi:MAG: PQQ-dependent sugar dehydrogenase [Ignavibacteriaceae bacterium]